MFFVLIFFPKAISFHIWCLKCICIFLLFTKGMGQSCTIFLDFMDSPSQTYMKWPLWVEYDIAVRISTYFLHWNDENPEKNQWCSDLSIIEEKEVLLNQDFLNAESTLETTVWHAKFFTTPHMMRSPDIFAL